MTPPVIKDNIEGEKQQDPTDGAETMATKGHTHLNSFESCQLMLCFHATRPPLLLLTSDVTNRLCEPSAEFKPAAADGRTPGHRAITDKTF